MKADREEVMRLSTDKKRQSVSRVDPVDILKFVVSTPDFPWKLSEAILTPWHSLDLLHFLIAIVDLNCNDHLKINSTFL